MSFFMKPIFVNFICLFIFFFQVYGVIQNFGNFWIYGILKYDLPLRYNEVVLPFLPSMVLVKFFSFLLWLIHDHLFLKVAKNLDSQLNVYLKKKKSALFLL